MQLSNIPGKLVLPFANAGGKNAIPVDSQIGITAGAASLVDGFPPLTRTPIAAGGVPPSGLDMNGIIYELSAVIRWANAGGGYPFDNTFATDTNVGGYPKGARIMRADGAGYWYNTTDNNVTDPESSGAAAAGWVPDFTTGVAAVTMTSANVTLTPAQYGKPTIVITGALTGNLNLILPAIVNEWTVINNTTGAFTITCKTASGSGVVAPQSAASIVYGDATNIGGLLYAPLTSPAFTGTPTAPTPAQFDASTKIATTAFVAAMGLQKAGEVSVSGATTLTVAHAGKTISCGGSGGYALTLPAASAFPVGGTLTIVNSGTGAITAQCAGSNLIYMGSSAPTSISVAAGDTVILEAWSTIWIASAGAALLPYSALFRSSLAASGYQKLPSGLIIQWGVTASIGTDASVTVTFPIAFPNACLCAVAQSNLTPGGTGGAAISTRSYTITTMLVGNDLTPASATWIAIGY